MEQATRLESAVKRIARHLRAVRPVTLVASVVAVAPIVALLTALLAQPERGVLPKNVTLSFHPPTGTVLVGSTFDVPVILDTGGASVNAVEFKLTFSPGQLAVVRTSGVQTLTPLWSLPPTYSNANGTVSMAIVVPNGITTARGLLTTLTFRAKALGQATIEVLPTSSVLANDGKGSALPISFGWGVYTIVPHRTGGVPVSSDTHPFLDRWSNHTAPVFSWRKDADMTAFSYSFDKQPTTIPDNRPETNGTLASFEDVRDGQWYFHLKAQRRQQVRSGKAKSVTKLVWGATTHYPARIDTTPPAVFIPTVAVVRGRGDARRRLAFATTDALSGVEHYEVGLTDRLQSTPEPPTFVRVESPYELPASAAEASRAVVRALDIAGNVREMTIDLPPALP